MYFNNVLLLDEFVLHIFKICNYVVCVCSSMVLFLVVMMLSGHTTIYQHKIEFKQLRSNTC